MEPYHEEYERALHYSADSATVHHFLTELAKPEHNETRWGTGGDQTMRVVAADALSDVGREREGELLRGGGHVVLHEGKVKPGRFTMVHAERAARDLDTHVDQWSGYHHWLPDFSAHDVSGEAVDSSLHQNHDHPNYTHYPHGTHRVTTYNENDDDLFRSHVHATEVPGHLADVFYDVLNRYDHGWNTDPPGDIPEDHEWFDNMSEGFDRLTHDLRNAPVEEPAE